MIIKSGLIIIISLITLSKLIILGKLMVISKLMILFFWWSWLGSNSQPLFVFLVERIELILHLRLPEALLQCSSTNICEQMKNT